ncbi:RNA polymerase sigma factor [Methylosinus sp. PW1]|uniref:RNA polymerase sigma factor n=1 Tax=Methylosinus sp. PW1 TaxID=107636 RepID=UPI000567CA35|nr:sigma-70 family RNA polymerase sigma factor [Methylosinus sp. PW1]
MAACSHDLVVRAQGGDAAALDRLLAECRFDARRYATRHCMISEIDDAVQEALLIVVQRLSTLRTAASFAGWLFTVVRRECRRLSRRMVAHEELDEERIAERLAARPMDELRMELAFALESLPAHYLDVILLRDFEEMTIAEICERLEITVQTAKARLRRGRLLVREYLIGVDSSAAYPAQDRL